MKKMLAWAALTAMVLAATGIGGAAARAATAPRCHIGDLKVNLDPAQGENGMMHVGWVLSVTNISDHTCYVRGYPKLVLTNSRHMRLHTETYWGSTYFVADPGAHRIDLKPRAKAAADLEYSHIRQEGTEYAPYLDVTPPGETHYASVPLIDRYVFKGRLRVTAFASHLGF